MHYQAAPHISFTTVEEGEAVLVDLKTRRYYSLNESGVLIWQGVTDGLTEEGIADRLQEVYAIEREAALEHVQAFVRKLAEDGLLVPS